MTHPAVLEFFRENARKGGNARAAKLTKDERKKIARRAANARWERSMKRIDANLAEAQRIGRQNDKAITKLNEAVDSLEKRAKARKKKSSEKRLGTKLRD